MVITILLVAFATSNSLFAQITQSGKKMQTLSVGYSTGYNYSFDNRDKPNDFIARDNLFAMPVMNFGINIQAETHKDIFKFKYNHTHLSYPNSNGNRKEVGSIIQRWTFYSQLNWGRKLYNKGGFSINSELGLLIRMGEEDYVAGYYRLWDIQVVSMKLRDYGSGLGLTLNQNIGRKFSVFIESDFSYFVYRYNNGSRTGYTWDNGTTKWMYRLMIGLSYDVWTRKTKRLTNC
jgi:hypothetical protein